MKDLHYLVSSWKGVELLQLIRSINKKIWSFDQVDAFDIYIFHRADSQFDFDTFAQLWCFKKRS